MRGLIDSSRFILLDQLGAGGMGVVYEAYDQERGEFVALKTMRQVDQLSLVRFKQEFRTLSDLSHPNLINLYQLFAVEPPWYFTMELVDGCDFLTYVRGVPESDAHDTKLSDQAPPTGARPFRPSPSPPVKSASDSGFREARLRDALAQLVEGVHALHQAGKLHRDIKPTNVLVSRRGRVKLLDFGLIAELEPSGEHRDTDRQVVGTLAHMSPEQAVGLKVSRASDWYSVGVVLYQALTGRLPFDGSYDEVVQQKLRSVPGPPDSLVEGLPSDLVGLCMDLLKQAPSERPDGPTILARLRAALASASGMVLVTGPTGSGKTTTLYSALAELNSPDRKIITVEDPVEYRLPGLNQVQVNDKVDFTFARVLRSCLRQDPDVILVGEMRDQETAEIGLRAALTGHLVLSTLHTLDAFGTPMRLRDMGIAPYMIALGVRLVLAQRLLRTICEHCKRPHELLPHEQEWLRLEEDPSPGSERAYWQGVGCSHCSHSGYRGRVGVYEMMEMTPELVHLANKDEPAAFAVAARKIFAQHTLRHHALQLVHAGRTTLAEAMQASNQF